MDNLILMYIFELKCSDVDKLIQKIFIFVEISSILRLNLSRSLISHFRLRVFTTIINDKNVKYSIIINLHNSL